MEEGGLTVFMTVTNLQRKPSLLSSKSNLQYDATGSPRSSSSEAGSPTAHVHSVLQWTKEDVEAWLAEAGMEEYLVSSHVPRGGALSLAQPSLSRHTHAQSLFREHGLESGRGLVRLQETHLKEMGVAKVGHRLELAARVSELRRAAGVTGDGVDVHSLLAKYVVIPHSVPFQNSLCKLIIMLVCHPTFSKAKEERFLF